MAVSLRTRDPDRARALGAKLTGLALRAREQVRIGSMSIGDVREHFIEAGPGKRFYFDQACRLLGLRSVSAHVGPGERARLRDEGLSERELDEVDAVARRHARVEDARDWLIGPERAVFVHH